MMKGKHKMNMPKSRPIIVTQSVLAGLDVIAVSSALGDLVPVKVALAFILLTKAVQVGVAFYVQSITVGVGDVAAYRSESDQIVAGPAAGPTNGTPVTVESGTVVSGHVEDVDPHRF